VAESYDAPYASHEAVAACFLSIPLATIGQIDHVVGTRLDAFLKAKCAGEDCDPRCIWFGFTLAKSTPRQASEALRSALRCLAFASPGHALDGTKVTVGDILIASDGDLIQDVAGALDDTDPNVVAGVIWLFSRIGLNAQEYAPRS
jgi:hypothetical protein